MKKFVTAMKENTNGLRTKVLIVSGVLATAVAAGIVLTKLSNQTEELVLVFEEGASNLSTPAE